MRRSLRWLVNVSSVLALALALVAAAAPTTAAKARAPKAPILIGGTLGLTGLFAEPSAQYQLVYDYWVNQVNAHGGLLGRPVRLILYNDQSSPGVATGLYERLINQDHVNFLLAPYTTYVGAPIVPIALAHHMILFNGGFVGIQLFDQAHGWMFSTYNYQEPQFTEGFFQWLNSLPKSKRPKRLGVLTDENPFTLVDLTGYKGQGGVEGWAKKYGFHIVLNQKYPEGISNVTSLIEQAKNDRVDCLIALTLPDSALLIARTASQLGYHPEIMFFGGSEVTTLPNWGSLGKAANGTMGTTVAWPSEHFAGMEGLTKMFLSHGIKVMPSYGPSALAILQVLQQAVEATHSLNQATLRSYILTHTFNTAIGKIRYYPNGTVPYGALVLQFLNGRNIVVWPRNLATGNAVVPMP